MTQEWKEWKISFNGPIDLNTLFHVCNVLHVYSYIFYMNMYCISLGMHIPYITLGVPWQLFARKMKTTMMYSDDEYMPNTN